MLSLIRLELISPFFYGKLWDTSGSDPTSLLHCFATLLLQCFATSLHRCFLEVREDAGRRKRK